MLPAAAPRFLMLSATRFNTSGISINMHPRGGMLPRQSAFIITTDGMENASRRHSVGKVKNMIERQKTKYGWEFLFASAQIWMRWEPRETFGIAAERAVTYVPTAGEHWPAIATCSARRSPISAAMPPFRPSSGRAALSKTKAASQNNRAVFHAELFCLFPNNAKSRQRPPAAQTLFKGTP